MNKLKQFKYYKKTINTHSIELKNKFNLRIDKAKRLYTVLNIPEEIFGEAYSIKKSDIDKISENFIRAYSQELFNYLNSKNLIELYKLYDFKKVGKYSYLLVYGFSLFNSVKYYNLLYYILLPILIIGLSTTLIILI
jgi:hypothetical protein